MNFGCQSSIIHTSEGIHIDIQARMQGHSAMDIRKKYPLRDIHVLWISVFNYPCFMDIHLGILRFLWKSMH